MKKLFWISLLIAVLAAFFASTCPDGLDFISEKFGFAGKGVEHSALMYGYSLNFLPEGCISTALAGIAGVLITLAVFWLTACALKKRAKNNLNRFVCLFLLALIAASPACLPAGKAFAARPLVTDDFYTVAPGRYELEIGYASTQNQASLANTLGLSFKRGFLPQFDFGIEVPYTTSSPSGLNDVLLHAKYRLWEKSEDEGLTGRVDYKFSNGDVSQGLGSGDNDFCLLLIYSKMFGQTKAHLNFGHVTVGVNAGIQSDDYFAYSLALEHPAWGEKGDIVAEYVANNALQPNPAFIQLGARYAITSGFKLDAGYSFGLNDNSINNSLTAGIHCEF